MKKNKLFWQIPFLLILILGTVWVIRSQHNMPYQHNQGFIFGTIYHVTYQYDKDLEKEIVEELNKVDQSLSPFNKTSIITKVNRNEDVTTDKMFEDVFNLAEDISAKTEGYFDITVAPMVNTWGFGFKQGKNPSKHTIDSLRAIVGFDKVKLKNHKVIKSDKRIMLDCSAIAKGYGSDVVAQLMESKGIQNYMIEIGGEVVTRGVSDKRVPWRIGVTKPTDDSLSVDQELQTVLNITDKAMATSGNYRKFYYKNGKKYAHTIDPKTGYPVQHSLLSATVLAKNCATADAYATAFMAMGIEKAEKVLEEHPELLAYFIYSDDKNELKVWYSPKLKNKILNN